MGGGGNATKTARDADISRKRKVEREKKARREKESEKALSDLPGIFGSKLKTSIAFADNFALG